MVEDNTDFSDTIKPKSDQLNADDLLLGPITVTITGVKRGNAEQPAKIQLNNGFQPFMPCKSMRRVLIGAWGPQGRDWIGRSMQLYRDPKVRYGGAEVGGIRIRALSHIKGELSFSLTITRGKREPYTVQLLAAEQAPQVQQYPDDRFKEKLADMRKQYHGGKMTIDEIARKCESVGRLTAFQREQITAKEKPPEQAAAAKTDDEVNF